MILQALVSYYEALAERGAIARPGWGRARVQFALELDDDGGLKAVFPLEATNEKGKPIPTYYELPAAVKRTVGIAPNFLWDNAAYLLGLDGKGKPERALKCFEAAKELHLGLLSDSDAAFARAICAFFRSWEPGSAAQEPLLADCLDAAGGGANFTFMYRGAMPDSAPELKRAWQRRYDGASAEAGEKMRCLVTGEQAVPAPVHPSIMRVRGAQSSGAALVSFNAPAFCSFEREQNLNAPVSKYAAFAYTTALNHLIADTAHTRLVGDTTVVYWAESAGTQYQDAFGCSLDGDTVTDNDLKGVMTALAKGENAYWDALPLKPDNHFYILGLAPNAARLSVRFFLSDSFGSFEKRLNEHYERLEIVRPDFDKEERLPLWKLLRETVNLNSRDKSASPQMAGDTLRAMLSGGSYPATLYQQTELRIRAERSITRGRAAIIKAYLLRNMDENFNKEALTVELNEKTTYQPYILGRMFSVLEDIQEKANPGINTTIKDKYFTSACATPAVVFPTLIKLAEKHLRKMDDAGRVWFSKQLQALTALLTESYPAHLTLSDQGIFQLGYYHQTQKRYEKKKPDNKEEEK
ncbi:MAG: type I-C CRISPR-associated protein Cas8c/Csd1 [Oscillospiraceae bacterium]|nr:type I-C CRISPR-associated protein Cas8c/Csd1 [Oscillospiraceae bacterium]